MESALYSGMLRHRRFRPTWHKFSYPVVMAFLDIDRIPQLMRGSPPAAAPAARTGGGRTRRRAARRTRLPADALTLPGLLLQPRVVLLLLRLSGPARYDAGGGEQHVQRFAELL